MTGQANRRRPAIEIVVAQLSLLFGNRVTRNGEAIFIVADVQARDPGIVYALGKPRHFFKACLCNLL